MRFFLLLLIVGFTSACANSTPAPAAKSEASTLTPSGYVRQWPGTLPIVLSVPHDGGLNPADIPDRSSGNYFVTVRDSNARELAEAIRTALLQKFGKAPSLIVCELSRKKVDCNRELAEGATPHSASEKVWQEYHAAIDQASQNVLAHSPHGLYLDIHSHGHALKRIEIGYLLKPDEIRLNDAELNQPKSVREHSSIRELSHLTPSSFAELLRGPQSLGGLLEARGIPAIPSPQQKLNAEDPYFNGAYDVLAHGSRDRPQLDGAQLEVPQPLRDTPEHRTKTAEALADALDVFFKQHYHIDLNQ